jgi:adenylate cyclase
LSVEIDGDVVCLSYIALVLWLLGYPDQALRRSHEALTRARELSYPHVVVFAFNAAFFHCLRRDGPTARKHNEEAVTLAAEQGFPYWLAGGTFRRGWVLAEQGQREEGIARMRQGLAAWRGVGAKVNQPYFLSLLAEAHGKVKQAREGLTLLDEALAIVDRTGERYYEAEVYRLKGELLAQKVKSKRQKEAAEAAAEEYLWQAVEVARR